MDFTPMNKTVGKLLAKQTHLAVLTGGFYGIQQMRNGEGKKNV